ncbi:MAG: 1,4-alpha-glucan branching protein GlgB [Candidatus Solibacter usitatus]|nr:1,4-alpha-glucan branching protein GlgB [Candidatus Solibacter usitatus]
MKPGELEAIAGGYHGDPFAVLGPHRLDDGWVIRAYLPQASSASVRLPDDLLAAMTRVHPEGVFEAPLGEDPGRYRLRVERQDGSVEEIEDPYRFPALLSDYDIYLHAEGTNYQAWNSMGSHLAECEGVPGCRFAVWAPNAEMVSVAGDFNQWDPRRHPMRRRQGGIWELFLPGVGEGEIYKYFVRSHIYGVSGLKFDPYGFASEKPPKQASVVWDLSRYQWGDQRWMEQRGATNWLERPVSCYEVHLESWMRTPEGEPLTYRELADQLAPYVKRLGFTHIELMPIAEHPYSGSWGYQVVGYFAPTARFGSPDDFRHFVDRCHQEGIGIIVDWVPAHFPKDAHGLARFDGTACYEHEDTRMGEHKGWGTLIFNFGRNEVRNFLISNAMFWLKEYHIDGLRVDAVASMLYLDYSREEGEWVPNKYGGRENLEAIDFLRKFNEEAHTVPGALTIAEESTSFAAVSHPVYSGGLGFTMKWNMGWMHDMFAYFKSDPVFRKFNHNHITFSLLYAFTENFVLPISHDEVVHGKGSLIGKMPGDDWQRFANVRAFLGYMWGHPGKKLLFMGTELGQYEEWNWQGQIRWDLLQYEKHHRLQDYVRELNYLYQTEPSLYEVDYKWQGFEWIDFHDVDNSVISFLRRGKRADDYLIFVCNFTPLPRYNYNVGVPEAGCYQEILNSDWEQFGGSGMKNEGDLRTSDGRIQGRFHFLTLALPPLGVTVYRRVGG